MSLPALPVEIMMEIGRYVYAEEESCYLLPFAVACSQTYAAIRTMIALRISLRFATCRYKYLLRTIAEIPDYGRDIRELSFVGDQPKCQNAEDPRLDNHEEEHFLIFLHSFPNLSRLHITFKWSQGVEECLRIVLAEGFPARHVLRHLSFEAPGSLMKSTDLLNLLTLPCLQSLSVSAGIRRQKSISKGHLSSVVTLRHLDLATPRYSNHWRVYNYLYSLLEACPELQCLAFNIPVQGTIFSVVDLNESLALLAGSLRRLTLRTNGRRYVLCNTSVLDLSKFGALEDLCASAWCFFAPLHRKSLRDCRKDSRNNGIQRLLPSSIKQLAIEFPIEIGVFSKDNSAFWDPSSARYQFIQSEEFTWISQLAYDKPSQLPQLREIILSEDLHDPNASRCVAYAAVNYNLPAAVADTLGKHSIRYVISLRGEPCYWMEQVQPVSS